MKNNKAKIIEAINILITHYSQYPADSIPPSYNEVTGEDCPLCKAAHVIVSRCNKFVWHCDVCPWVIFEGLDCMTHSYHKQTSGERIARLQGWNKKLLSMGGLKK